MAYPIYDKDVMPFIVYPYSITQASTKKYLGKKAITGERTISLSFQSANRKDSMKLLYDFWKDDCNYGTTSFLIPLPTFGDGNSGTIFLVNFTEDLTMNYNVTWEMKQKLTILGEVSYVVDDNGDYVTADDGDYVISSLNLGDKKEINYL